VGAMLCKVLFVLFLTALVLGFAAMAAAFFLYLWLGAQGIWKACTGHGGGAALREEVNHG